jgi:bacterioferritin (cytochrome b1)
MDKLDAIAERLNMLDTNPELEAEWDQLRELGDCYRQLEQDLKTKSAMWKTLKTKTPSKPRS